MQVQNKLSALKHSFKRGTGKVLSKVISSLSDLQKKINEGETEQNQEPEVKIPRKRYIYKQPTLAESIKAHPVQSEDELEKIKNLRQGKNSDGTPIVNPEENSALKAAPKAEKPLEIRLEYAPKNSIAAEDASNVTKFLMTTSRLKQKYADSDPLTALVNIPQPTYYSKETVHKQYDLLQQELFLKVTDKMVENEDVDSSNYHPRNLGKMMASYCVDTEGNYVHSKLTNAIKDYVKNSDNKLLMKSYADQLKKIVVSETVL